MTGVDKLHTAVVAVVDTGVQYNHPAVGLQGTYVVSNNKPHVLITCHSSVAALGLALRSLEAATSSGTAVSLSLVPSRYRDIGVLGEKLPRLANF